MSSTATTTTTTHLPAVLDSFTEKWSPRLVASVNDHHVKVAKIDGEFIWHSHPNSDELFHIIAGKVTMELEGRDPVQLGEGDMFVVHKGVRHRPIGHDATILMMEHESTVNTGDETDSEMTKVVKDVRTQSS